MHGKRQKEPGRAAIFVRLVEQESAFDPDAFNPATGGVGIVQLRRTCIRTSTQVTHSLAWTTSLASWPSSTAGLELDRALLAHHYGLPYAADWDGSRESLSDDARRYLDAILGPVRAEQPGGSVDISAGKGPGAETVHARTPTGYRVAEDGIRLRQAPSTSAAIMTVLQRDTIVIRANDESVNSDGHTWLQVLADDLTGWIAAEFLQPTGEPTQMAAHVARGEAAQTDPIAQAPHTTAVAVAEPTDVPIGVEMEPSEVGERPAVKGAPTEAPNDRATPPPNVRRRAPRPSRRPRPKPRPRTRRCSGLRRWSSTNRCCSGGCTARPPRRSPSPTASATTWGIRPCLPHTWFPACT